MQRKSTFNIPRFAIVTAVSLLLAFMPFTVNLNKYRITLERNEAHAVAPVFAGALAFLEECASAAGFASVGDFIATGAGITAVASGLTIGTAAGINLGNTASDNLGHLIDAADYPAWDTLSSTEQSNWGSADNYNAAKYNSLMAGFGLETDYQNYQQMWGTGQSFEFSASGQSKLDQIGQIGENWLSGIGNSVDSLRGLISRQQVVDWAPAACMQYVNPENDASWPAGLSTTINYQNTSSWIIQYMYSNQLQTVNWVTSNNVVVFGTNPGVGRSFNVVMASKEPFDSGNAAWSSLTPASQYSSNSRTFYAATSTVYNSGDVPKNTVLMNGTYQVYGMDNQTKYAIANVLYGQSTEINNEIASYPESDIDNGDLNQIIIIYPEDGIKQDTDWQDLLKSNDPVVPDPEDPEQDNTIIGLLQHIDSDLHKFNFYNNGELKVNDEGVFTELSDIYSLLMEISGKMGNWGDIGDAPDIIGDFDFDDIEDKIPNLLDTIEELAPFGSVLLLSEIYTILSNFAQIEEPVMTFPFDFGGLPGQDTDLEIDLSWMDDIKPVINFFCILMLLLAITHATIRIVELEAAS